MLEEARLRRTIEDDMFTVNLFFECNYLMNIDIEVKDRANIPAVDLENQSAVSQWCYMLWGNMRGMMLRVPQKTPAVPAVVTERRGGPRLRESFVCPKCGVALVEKKSCCGDAKPVFRCPKCGVGYKAPENRTSSAMAG